MGFRRNGTRVSSARVASILLGVVLTSFLLAGIPVAAGAATGNSKYVIMVATPVTGNFAIPDGSEGGVATAWAKWINKSGGVNGHQVQVVIANTQSSASTAVSVMQQDVEQYHPDAVVTDDEAIETQIAAYLSSTGLPVIGGAGNVPSIWHTDQNYFTIVPLTDVGEEADLQSMETVGVKSFGAVVCAEVPVCATIGSSLKTLAPKYKLGYQGLLTASATAPDYTAQCVALAQKNVSAIYMALAEVTIISMMKNCATQGYKGAYVAGDDQAEFNAFPTGTTAVGSLISFPWWSNAAPVKTYRSVMQKYTPQGFDWKNTSADATWATLQLFAKAMAGAPGSPSSSQVFDAYYKIKDQTLGGLLPQPITFTKGTPSPLVKCSWLFEYKGGKLANIHRGASGNGQQGDLQTSCVS